MNLKHFSHYLDFEPKIPVWAVTPHLPGCIHRFFDTSPISPSGRYLAVFQLPFEDRQPHPGESGNICIVDLETGEDRIIATTCGWEPQLGANINWGTADNELFFNDVDTTTWQPFAWKLNPLTGERQKMGGTVYHASADGKWLISANLATMRIIQPGYGVCLPDDAVRRNLGPVDDDGFYITDTATGKSRLLISISDILQQVTPTIQINTPESCEIYGFHSKFNPQGNKLMLSLRWFQTDDEPQWNMFKCKSDRLAVRFAWITVEIDDKGYIKRNSIYNAVGPEQWKKPGHHATWFPNGEKISMNLAIDNNGLRFVQVNANGSELKKMLDETRGSGHPTVTPDETHILTDTYEWEDIAFGDGTIPLRWIDLKTGEEATIVRIPTRQPAADSVLRVDPHPAWDRTWRYITFNAFINGSRQVFIGDMQPLLKH